MGTQSGATHESNETKAFNRMKNILGFMRTQIKNKHAKGEPFMMGAFLSHQKISGNLSSVLYELKAIEKEEGSGGRSGSIIEWVYKNREGNDEVDTKLVDDAINAMRERSRAYAEKKKLEAPRAQTASFKKKKKFDFESTQFQIEWLKDKLNKEDLAPGYLRPGEKEMYQRILLSLETMGTLTTMVAPALESLKKLNDALHS
jgi:hypothetical protein